MVGAANVLFWRKEVYYREEKADKACQKPPVFQSADAEQLPVQQG